MLRATRRWLSASRMPPQHPLIAIVGATGTGKSRLAVSLAQRFNGEIINGDVLQMYEGLPIVTNKITLEERKGIQHHLLGCIKVDQETWTVRQFVDSAAELIEDIRSRNKVPILVGGTHYYTQSLLFTNTVVDEDSEHVSKELQEQRWPILKANTSEMLDELYKVDPLMAVRWHPHDQRKIRRSLEVCLTTGKKASDIYHQQRRLRPENRSHDTNQSLGDPDQPFTSDSGVPLRYSTLILWTHAASDILNKRLEERVDGMVSEGLLEEVRCMHTFQEDQTHQGRSPDQSRGIWVAIGFKEFEPYITHQHRSERIRKESIERTKIATRQYARRQVRWIRIKLQRAVTAADSSHSMYLLDSSNLSQWQKDVEAKASEITASFLNGAALPEPSSLSDAALENLGTTKEVTQSARFCMACDKTLMTDEQWMGHLKSKGHRKAMRPKIDWEEMYPDANRTGSTEPKLAD